MWMFVVYLFLALQVAACVIAVVSRMWRLTPEPIVWRGISVDRASAFVQAFIWDVNDGKFAYPTGMFVPADDADVPAGRVIMREDDFKGSRGFGWGFAIVTGTARAWHRSSARSNYNEFALFFGFIIVMMFALALAAPFFFAAMLDVVYRRVFRSRITARVEAHPDIDDAVTVRLEFRGLSAFGIVPDVMQGMTAPARPGAASTLSPTPSPDQAGDAATTAAVHRRAAAWATSANERFRVIYGSAVVSAFVVALVLALVVGTPSSNDSYDGEYVASEDSSVSSSSSSSSADEESSSGDEGAADETGGDASGTEEGATDTSMSSRGFVGEAYGIDPPDGWIQDSDESDEGAFTESRWHESGDDDTFVKVNHTAGYSGTAAAGARSVRRLFLKRADYVEHRWESAGEGQWLWEFSTDGTRKLDVFSSRCGDGYAVLGSTAEDEFDDYRDTFQAFADSLIATCEDGGSSDGSTASADETTEETPEEPEAPTASLVGADQQTYATSTRSGAMEQMLRRHYQARVDGKVGKAYDFFGVGSPLRSRVGSRSAWGQVILAGGLTSIAFDEVRSLSASDAGGKLFVRFRTFARENVDEWGDECRAFTARFEIRRLAGKWKIWDSEAKDRAC